MNEGVSFWRFLAEERGYRRLWLSTALSELASVVVKVTFLLLVHERAVARGGVAESANALMFVAQMIPMIAFGPIAGALVDRLDRRALLVGADLVQMALAACVPLAMQSSADWPLYALAMSISAVSTLFPPTRQSSIPDLVGLDRAAAANAISSSTTSFVFILGAGTAGALLGEHSKTACFLAAGAAFLGAAFAAVGLRLPRHGTERHGTERHGALELLREAAQGVGHVRRRPGLLFIVLLYVLSFVFIGIPFPLMPEFVRGGLGADADTWIPRAWLAFGVGGIVGGALGPWLGRRFRMGRTLVATFFVEPLLIAGVFLAESPWTVVALWFAWGVLAFAYFVQEHTIIQEEVEPGMRGRVFGLLPPLQALGTLIANALVLLEAGRIAPRTMFLLAGVTYFLVSTAALLLLPGGRELWRRPNRAPAASGVSDV